MKVSLQTQSLGAGSANVLMQVPPGMRARLLGARFAVTAAALNGNVMLTFAFDQQPLATVTTGALSPNCAEVDAALGSHGSTLAEASVDPVTGVVAFNSMFVQTMPLPDLWLERNFRLIVTTSGGVGALLTALCYALEKNE